MMMMVMMVMMVMMMITESESEREREGNKLNSTNLAIVHSLDIYRDSLDIYREAQAESLDITIPDIFLH